MLELMLDRFAFVKKPSVFVTFLHDHGLRNRESFYCQGFFSRAPESGLNCRFREEKKDQNILPCVAGGKSVATTRARNILGYLQIVGN